MKDKYGYFFIVMGFILGVLFLIETVSANTEKHYQDKWCVGEKEVVLDDRTRVDCLTPDFAIEIDWANKWQEALGQSLHYGYMTDRRPGIVLIMRSKDDMKYWERMQKILWDYRLPIQTWMIWGE